MFFRQHGGTGLEDVGPFSPYAHVPRLKNLKDDNTPLTMSVVLAEYPGALQKRYRLGFRGWF